MIKMQEKGVEIMKKPLKPSNNSRKFSSKIGVNSGLNLSNSKTRGKAFYYRIFICF